MQMLKTVAAACLALTLGAFSAHAESAVKFAGLGPVVGIVDAEGLDTAIMFGGVVDLGTLSENVGLEGDVGFWSKSVDFGFFTVTEKVKYRDLSFGGVVKYYFKDEGETFRPYGGGGLGLHLLKVSVDVSGESTEEFDSVASASDTKIGLDLLGGALFGKSEKMKFLAEGRYTIVSDWTQFSLRGGVLFKLGE